jgi:hypothetical protein
VDVGPVAVGEAATKTGCCTTTVTADVDNARGVDVGSEVIVGRAVFVAEGARAVCVRKIIATMVSAFAAIVASMSGVGWPGPEGAQAASRIPMRSNTSKDR